MQLTDQIGNRIDPSTWTQTSTGGTLSNQNSVVTHGQYKAMSYPEELGQPRYPFYVMFYINANGRSELVTSGNVGTVNVPQNQQRGVGQGIASNPNVSVQNMAQGIVNAGSQAANFVNSTLGNNAKIKETINSTSKTLSAQAAKVTATPPNKRLDVAMALPIPSELNYNQSAHYDLIGSGGILGSAISSIANDGLGGGLKKLASDMPVWGAADAAQVGGLASSALGEGPSAGDFKRLAMKMMGYAQNERKEQVFKGMEPRSFTFSWLLVPKTQKESNTIRDIIKFFKYNQYPEVPVSSSGLNVITPNEIDIELRYNDAEMQNVAKISTCIISNINVNYTALGKWVAFDGTDNPVATHLSITFSEVEPLTRASIALGY